MKEINHRTTEYEINDVFLKRFSPRAMSGEPIKNEVLMTLFEAARWAPSSRNIQPWRFVYSLRGTPDFDLFLSFLVESNQIWCKDSGALVVVISKKTDDKGEIDIKHSLCTGMAFENLALQGTNMDLVVHGMGGYQEELIRKELNLSDDYDIEMMVTIGYPGKIEDLPEKLQEREKPSQRKDLDEIVFMGKDGAKNLV